MENTDYYFTPSFRYYVGGKIIVMNEGKIEAEEKHHELMQQEGLYRNFVEIRENAIGWELGGRA